MRGRSAIAKPRPTARSVATLAGVLLLAAASSEALADPPTLACDPLDPALCLLPFPNDVFTTADAAMDTGRRVAFQMLPSNVLAQPIDPSEWNRNDGFSPGSPVLTFVPELDLSATWGTQGEPTSLPVRGSAMPSGRSSTSIPPPWPVSGC